ncbi:proprotein convertase P-domain-containing protein [Lysobacter antibioticus]|uniref:proprotein convertase P-domain-containing protein n=1 Tax=Lysobacter antibioticus TaxID=84531 RepID=UPI0009DC96FC
MHNRSGGSADNVTGTFTKNLSSEPLNGTWKLRAADRASQDVGRIDTWSITF